MPYLVSLYDSRGVEMPLDYPHVRFKEVDGIGMAPVRHLEEQYAQQNGTTYLASYLSKRIIPMRWDVWAKTEAEMWDARDTTLRLISVLEQGFKLRLTLPNGNVRQIDLRYDSGLTMPRDLGQSDLQQIMVAQCVAHNPLWYDPTSVLWAYAVSGGAGEFGFETDGLAFPVGFGGSVAAGVPETKEYDGSWDAYPTITLRGPMTTPILTNHTLDLKLEFVSGYQIDEGETVVIDLAVGSDGRRPLTVTHSVDGNAPAALTNDSDLGTWRIARHPDAVDGNNSISVAFTGGNVNSQAEIRFFPQYVGV